MLPGHDRTKGLEILEEIELVLAQLYRTYAEQYPDHEDIWSGFACEQIRQARSVRGLRAKAEIGVIALKSDRFSIRELKVFREHIKGLFYSALERRSPLRAAIEAASFIQWSILNQEVLTTFRDDPKEVRNVLTGLAVAACRRRDRLLGMLEETSRTPPDTKPPEVELYSETRDPLPGPGVEYSVLGHYPLDL